MSLPTTSDLDVLPPTIDSRQLARLWVVRTRGEACGAHDQELRHVHGGEQPNQRTRQVDRQPQVTVRIRAHGMCVYL